MSFKVLVIPEDPTHNGYLLKPLVERILGDTGKPNAKVTVLTNPRFQGYDQASKAIKNSCNRSLSAFRSVRISITRTPPEGNTSTAFSSAFQSFTC